MSRARYLGLDLAWSARNPSGLAALDACGCVVDARADVRGDDDILAWVRTHLADDTILAFDMPTIVRNPEGARPCERDLAADFRAAHAGPHPANLRRFPDGGRARHMLDALAADGVTECLELPPSVGGRFALEVFPHPALVRLFGLPTIFKYKKKSRPWSGVLDEWARYRAALATLATADPALLLPAWIPERVDARGYKRWDDLLDAVTCAYVAAYAHRYGTARPYMRIYGDLTHGYIAIPDLPAVRMRPGRERDGI